MAIYFTSQTVPTHALYIHSLASVDYNSYANSMLSTSADLCFSVLVLYIQVVIHVCTSHRYFIKKYYVHMLAMAPHNWINIIHSLLYWHQCTCTTHALCSDNCEETLVHSIMATKILFIYQVLFLYTSSCMFTEHTPPVAPHNSVVAN